MKVKYGYWLQNAHQELLYELYREILHMNFRVQILLINEWIGLCCFIKEFNRVHGNFLWKRWLFVVTMGFATVPLDQCPLMFLQDIFKNVVHSKNMTSRVFSPKSDFNVILYVVIFQKSITFTEKCELIQFYIKWNNCFAYT